MVNGRAKIDGGVVSGGADPDEVDEVSEQVHPDLLQDIKPESLDDFLRDLHGETVGGTEAGMPSVIWLRQHFKTKSAVIRYLHHKGHSVRDISKHLGLRYQHVRNVLTVELKRGPNEDWSLSEDETRRISPGLNKI